MTLLIDAPRDSRCSADLLAHTSTDSRGALEPLPHRVPSAASTGPPVTICSQSDVNPDRDSASDGCLGGGLAMMQTSVFEQIEMQHCAARAAYATLVCDLADNCSRDDTLSVLSDAGMSVEQLEDDVDRELERRELRAMIADEGILRRELQDAEETVRFARRKLATHQAAFEDVEREQTGVIRSCRQLLRVVNNAKQRLAELASPDLLEQRAGLIKTIERVRGRSDGSVWQDEGELARFIRQLEAIDDLIDAEVATDGNSLHSSA